MNNMKFCISMLLVVLFAENVFSQNVSDITKADSSEIFNKIKLKRNGRIILYHNDIISEKQLYSVVLNGDNFLMKGKVKKAKRSGMGEGWGLQEQW